MSTMTADRTRTQTPAAAPAIASWRALGVDVRIAVTDPTALASAQVELADDLEALDRACSRFRADSEIATLDAADGETVAVSRLLGDALAVALRAATDTDGAVDPTLGQALVALGYDRDFAALPADRPATVHVTPLADWTQIRLERTETGGLVTMPAGTHLDLGATAKALGADLSAHRIADLLGCGVLVSLGGDIAVAGPAPDAGWPIRIQDLPGAPEDPPVGPWQTVAIRSGGLATSSVRARRWTYGATEMHHILDPRTGLPARSPWRTVSVTAVNCVTANTATTAAIVVGDDAVTFLTRLGLPARLVASDGTVHVLNGWPP